MKEQTSGDAKRGDLDRWKRMNWRMIGFIAGIGALMMGLIFVGIARSDVLYRKYFPMTDAAMEMRMEAISAYLWFEEMLGGDKSTDIKDILTHLDQADWYAEAMIKGGENVHLNVPPAEAAHFQTSVSELKDQLAKQRSLLIERLDRMPAAGAGSEIDKQYHAILETFIEQSKALEMRIKDEMARGYRITAIIWIAVMGGCVGMFLVMGFAFYRYERLRRRHYLEMLDMPERIVQNEKLASLGSMIAGIAHEMNNPNNFISFNLPILTEYIDEVTPVLDEFAQSHPDAEFSHMSYTDFRQDLYRIIRNIENGSSRINQIVARLKEFSRKKDQSNKDVVHLERLIDGVVAIYGAKIRKRVQSFSVHVDADLPPIYCDPELIESITANFLMNAADAADKPDSFVALNVFATGNPVDTINIQVEDNGCGIAKENIGKVSDPFFSTKSPSDGGGMGLYVCNTYAAQLGATITIESVVGHGSTFRLSLQPEKLSETKSAASA